jgi:hypothetical protein
MTSSQLQQALIHSPAPQWTPIDSAPIDASRRWQIYFRLRELDLACQCRGYQPLQVEVNTVQDAVQVWSVIRHCSASRLELAQWLNHCLALR